MSVKEIGQAFPVQVAQIVVYDMSGQAHAWEITGGVAEWAWTGVGPTGRSTATITIKGGEFRRRTKSLPTNQGEIE